MPINTESPFPASSRVQNLEDFTERLSQNPENVRVCEDFVEQEENEPRTTLAERKLIRKCDFHLIPILFVLFVFAFMDRINIGNVRIQGLEIDLNMSGNQYNIALFTFFPCYILFEVPSNIILRKVKPSTWLSGSMFAWGIITICQGLTRSYGGLIACRVLLGLFEAGFVPGGLYLMSMYYKRYELQLRATIWFGASILAGAFAGLLAFALASMDGIAGYSGWRWIFIIEGVATVVVAAVSKFLIPDWPEQVKFLSSEEKTLLERRLEQDQGSAKMDRMSRRDFLHIMLDWKIWAGVLQYLGIVTTSYSGAFLLPTILRDLGWVSVHAQVMTIPVYIVATILTLTVAFTADKLRHRSSFILLGQAHLSQGARYFATYLVVAGGYVAQPMCMGWLTNQMGGHYKRSVATGLQVGVGNIGGLVASNVYVPSQSPRYQAGYGTGLGMMWLAAVGVLWMLVGSIRENRRRERGERDYGLRLPEEQLQNLGDDHPHFRYTY